MRILVTGARGFVGRHLCAALRAAGHEVIGTSRRGQAATEALELPDLRGARQLLERLRPQALVHLAAIAEVPAAAADPPAALRVNVQGTACLLEALRELGLPCRFILVSTSNVYGIVPPDQQPIAEDRGCVSASVYAATKCASEDHVTAYRDLLAVPPVVVRPFNHVGPGQSERYALSSFAAQIARIERGLAEPVVRVGNLGVERDILDVRDVVRAYGAILETPDVPQVLNVCRGTALALDELLDRLVALARTPISVEVDPARCRKHDLTLLVGDPRRLQRATGWQPIIRIETTLRDLLDDWRGRLRAEPQPAGSPDARPGG